MARRPLQFFTSLLLLAACLGAAGASQAKSPVEPRGVDRFIVKFKEGSQPSGNLAARQRLLSTRAPESAGQVSLLGRMAMGADVLRTGRKLDPKAAQAFMNRLRRDPSVAYVEIDQRVKPGLVPNDSLYANNQWHYFEALGGINLPAAWDKATGAGVVVAVLDTGITTHDDLTGNIVPGYDFIKDLTTANDGDGRDADPSDPGDWTAADECGDGEAADDSSWHGTHVAGTIAALTNNSKGVAGVAFNAKVMPVRVLGRCGGYGSDIADAIVWAAGGSVADLPANANPVEVINLSLGGPGNCSLSTQESIDMAVAAGVIVVVAAGNDDLDGSLVQPGNCANVISVGATGRDGGRATDYSNYGPSVDVSAPGGSGSTGVASTYNSGKTVPSTGNYVLLQGTSMATPHVAGVAALMQSASAGSPESVEAVLKLTARPLAIACPEGCGAGIIDASAAITQVQGGVLTVSDVRAYEGNTGTQQFHFTVSLSKAMPNAVTFDVATVNETAGSGEDYAALVMPGQIIPAGQTSLSFEIAVNGDTLVEPEETFLLAVSNVVGIAVADAQGRGSIANDDVVPLANGVPVTGLSGAEGQSFLFAMTVPPGTTLVQFNTSGGSGDADLYVSYGVIPKVGEADCISYDPATTESCEPVVQAGTYYVLVHAFSDISGVTLLGAYSPSQPNISISDVSIAEGNAGTKLANFSIQLSKAGSVAVGFDAFTAGGTALAGVDFIGKTSVAQTIPAGQTSANFAVTINGDTEVEGHEAFTVNLSNVSGAVLSDGQALGRINNDDAPALFVDDVAVVEGNSGQSMAYVTVRLSSPSPSPVGFDIATANGSATAGSDYVARSQAGKYIDAGRTRLSFGVAINGDLASEGNESFTVVLANPSGAAIADGTATVTIANDDAAALLAAASRQGVVVSGAPVAGKRVVRTKLEHQRLCKRLLAKDDLDGARAEGCRL